MDYFHFINNQLIIMIIYYIHIILFINIYLTHMIN